MNRKTGFIYIFLCIALLSILTVGIYFHSPENDKTEYVLKDYNGNLAVFSPDNDSPIEILDINTSAFPEKDRQSLKKGIKVFSEDELFRLIEDFSG